MNRQEFGQLIAALRKEHFDPVVGKVWSQKVLAEKSGLSEKVIGNIEQGRKVNFDSATLWQLADALRLTRLERQVLFQLPTGFDVEPVPLDQTETIRASLIDSISDIMLPAMIHDACYNIVMANRIWLRLFDLPSNFFATNLAANYNMLRLIFDPISPITKHFEPQRLTTGQNAIHCFRYLSLPYRHTNYFSQLLADLSQHNTFRQLWASAQYEQDSPIDHIHHMTLGELTSVVTTTSLLCSGIINLHLSVLLPKNQTTIDRFGALGRDVGPGYITLSPWPHPLLR